MIVSYLAVMLFGFDLGMIVTAIWARHEDMKNEIKKLKGTRK